MPQEPTGSDQKDPADQDGAPREPWHVAAFVGVVVGVCSSLFAIWDKSEFPRETFTHPLYWFLLGMIFAAGALWSFCVRGRRWFRWPIILGLVALAIGTLVESALVARDFVPSDKVYTVAIFTFATDESAKKAASSLREGILAELNKESEKHPGQLLVRDRAREIKGETLEENLAYLRKWARRGGSCHQAVWIKMRLDQDGEHYVSEAYFLKISKFGNEQNSDEIGVYGPQGYWKSLFQTTPVGPERAASKELYAEIIDSIKFNWGLASYQRGSYDDALGNLTANFANVQFYAGAAAYQKAWSVSESNQLLEEAASHFQRAIGLTESKVSQALFHSELGKVYFSQLAMRRARDFDQTSSKAIAAFHRAGEIYNSLGRSQDYVDQLIFESSSFYERYVLLGHADENLDRARDLLLTSTNQSRPDSLQYAEIETRLGMIYYSQADYQKAISVQKVALAIVQRLGGVQETDTLRVLGRAQAQQAIQQGDEDLYNEGIGNLQKASQLCKGPHECYVCHSDTGDSAFFWATSQRKRASPTWKSELERAMNEYQAAEPLISRQQQVDFYAEVKRRKAKIYTERALGLAMPEYPAQDDTHKPLDYLRSALAELSAAIDALTQAGRSAETLYQDRVECYRRMSAYSSNASDKRQYAKLARLDAAVTRTGERPARTAVTTKLSF